MMPTNSKQAKASGGFFASIASTISTLGSAMHKSVNGMLGYEGLSNKPRRKYRRCRRESTEGEMETGDIVQGRLHLLLSKTHNFLNDLTSPIVKAGKPLPEKDSDPNEDEDLLQNRLFRVKHPMANYLWPLLFPLNGSAGPNIPEVDIH